MVKIRSVFDCNRLSTNTDALQCTKTLFPSLFSTKKQITIKTLKYFFFFFYFFTVEQKPFDSPLFQSSENFRSLRFSLVHFSHYLLLLSFSDSLFWLRWLLNASLWMSVIEHWPKANALTLLWMILGAQWPLWWHKFKGWGAELSLTVLFSQIITFILFILFR